MKFFFKLCFIISLTFLNSKIKSQEISINQIENFKNDFKCEDVNVVGSKIVINIFYNPNLYDDCSKSKLADQKNKCNYQEFLLKLKNIAKSKFNNVTINLYQINNSNELNHIELEGEYNKLLHLSAIIYYEDPRFLDLTNKLQKDSQFINSTPNRIYTFLNSVQTPEKNLKLYQNWYSLQLAIENQGNFCPLLDLPKEDLFINYLKLLFDPSLQEAPTAVVQNDKKGTEISKFLNDTILAKLELLSQQLEIIKNRIPIEGKHDTIKFSINLGFSILNPQKIATSQGFYSNQLSAAAMPLSYAADFQYWINNFRVGLGYAYSNYQFNNSLADNNYSIDWKSDKLSNASQMNIYASNLRESFSFEQHNLNLLAGYSHTFKKKEPGKNKFRIDVDLGLGYVLPFTLRSRLTDATISYRGLVNGIEDELINIAELGLVENDRTAIGKETALRMQGISLNTGLNLVYAYNNFNFKLGMGYHLNRYRNKSYNENQRLSYFSGDYQSSLYSNKQLSTQFNSFQFSIGYTIK